MSHSLHKACYFGNLELVRRLLAEGADPNAAAPADEVGWITCAGSRPRPLNCVAVAWAMTSQHVEIAELLIAHGAIVDQTVLDDHRVESCLTRWDMALAQVLEDHIESAPRPVGS